MDKEFSSTSLTGCVPLALDVGLSPCRACRAIRPPQADKPRRETTRRRAEPPARPAPTDGSRSPIPADPPPHPRPSTRSVAESRPPGRSRSSTTAPPGGHSRPRHGMPDMPAVRLAARFRQGAAAGHSPGHRLRRSVPPADTPAVAGRQRTWQTSPPSGRPDTPVQRDRLTDGSGPGPDGNASGAHLQRSASAHAPGAVRPRPVHPGPDRTGRPCAYSPSANPRRYQQRDLTVMTTCTHARCRTSTSRVPRPLSARPCPASTTDATLGQPSGHPMPGVSGRTPSTPPGTPVEPEATRTGSG
jgi:hypothetical protein